MLRHSDFLVTSIARSSKIPATSQAQRQSISIAPRTRGLVHVPLPSPLFHHRRYLQGMLSEQQRMIIPPLAGKKRNPCSHRSDRARALGRVATLFPCHCVTELAHEDPSHRCGNHNQCTTRHNTVGTVAGDLCCTLPQKNHASHGSPHARYRALGARSNQPLNRYHSECKWTPTWGIPQCSYERGIASAQ